MKIGVVGYGHAGRLYAEALDEIGQEIVLVADPSDSRRAEAEARHPQVSTAASFADAPGDPSLDALIVTTPLSSRVELASRALEVGKHVLVDGPLAARAQEAQQLADLALRRERVLIAGHPPLCGRAAQRLGQIVAAPESGMLLGLYATRSRRAAARRVPDLLFEVAAHDVALFAQLLGKQPEWLSARATRSDTTGQVNRLGLTLGYDAGPLAHIEIAPLESIERSRLTALTTDRRVVLEEAGPARSLLWVDDQGACGATEFEDPRASYAANRAQREAHFDDALRRLCEHFVARVASGRPGPEELEAAVGVVRVLETAARTVDDEGRTRFSLG